MFLIFFIEISIIFIIKYMIVPQQSKDKIYNGTIMVDDLHRSQDKNDVVLITT